VPPIYSGGLPHESALFESFIFTAPVQIPGLNRARG